MIYSIIFLISFILTHELGHYIVAKKQGIYKGFSIFPTPQIKLERKSNSKWDYLTGMIASLATFPLYLFTGLVLWAFPIFVVISGVGDIIAILVYDKLEDNENDNPSMEIKIPKFLIKPARIFGFDIREDEK